MSKIIAVIVSPLILAAMVLGAYLFTPAISHAEHPEHVDEHEHGDDHEHDEDTERLKKMQELVKILQQLVLLLSERVNHHAVDAITEHHHQGVPTVTELTISVEVHGDRTHVHVLQPGEEEVKFFLENLDIEEEDAIIAAIAEETGLDESDVREAATFPEDDEMEHEHEHEHADDDSDDDYDGIHIMADGTIMLGNGEEAEGATITSDGMIELSDGTIVEPEFDLR